MKSLQWIISVPIIAMMVGFAKAAQFASVDAFGNRLGFDLASLVGVAPVIAFYIYLAVKFPRLKWFGYKRG